MDVSPDAVDEGLGSAVAPEEGAAEGDGAGRDWPPPHAVAATITPRTIANVLAWGSSRPRLVVPRHGLAASVQTDGLASPGR